MGLGWLEVTALLLLIPSLVSIEDAPEQAFMPFVVTSFISSVQQLSKLGFGEVEHMITKYQDMTVSEPSTLKEKERQPFFSNMCFLFAFTFCE